MRIAWENLLKTATLSASAEDGNYPVENLYAKWKLLKFDAAASSTTITAEWDADVTISAIGIAYHNLTSCSVVLKNSGGSTLDTWTIPITNQTDLYIDTAETTVRSIVITAASDSDVYIGSFFAGAYIETYKTTGQNLPLKSTASVTKSKGGQVSGRLGVPIRGAGISIPGATNTEREEIEEAYEELQEVYPFWLDLWQSSHSEFAPVYGVFTSGLTVQKDDRLNFDISFDFEEVL